MARIATKTRSEAHGPVRTPDPAALAHPHVTDRPVGAKDRVSLRLGGGVDAAATARRALARLRADIDPPVLETLRLLVTELVSNSVRHTATEAVTLKVLVTHSSLWTEVTDQGPGFEPGRRRQGGEESGWGLFLVERLADRWGVTRDASQTRVWFELRR